MPPGGMRMRFTTNHDETAWDDPPLKLFGGSAGARAAYVAIALLPGRPLLYDGQEVESPQKLGLFERQPIVWNQPQASKARTFYASVVKLARTEPALVTRDLTEVKTSAPDDVISYRRRDLVVLVNARSHPVRFAVSGVNLAGARDLLSSRVERGDTVALPAYGAVVLKGPKQQSQGSSGVDKRDVFYQIFVRSFRDSNGDHIGDLRGIEEKLGYLQDLGVTSILLTPINPSPFYHNYFAYELRGRRLDVRRPGFVSRAGAGDSRPRHEDLPRSGDSVRGGGQSLAAGVAEESGIGVQPIHPVQQRREHGSPSPVYSGSPWCRCTTGAKVNIASLNLLHSQTQRYFQNLFASLVDPNGDGRFDDGVDGFRIDHMMDDLDLKGKLTGLFADFWAPVFAQARATNPRIRIIAEQYDWGYGEDFLTRGGVDMVFAFPLRNAILSLKRDSIAGTIAEMGRRTPPGKGQLVFIENHDMNRFASEVEGDARKERIGAALNILLDGTPLIYYGQEIGMKGRQNKTWGTDANDIPVREAFEWARRGDAPAPRLGTGAPARGGPIATPRMPTDYRSRRRRAIQLSAVVLPATVGDQAVATGARVGRSEGRCD